MKILIIDDNAALVRSLRDFLGKDFIIDTARTAKSGLRQAITAKHDIIILDIGLPDGRGDDVCRQIRANHIISPILILSGVQSVQSRVDLLETGADDYLVKPFSLAELRARIVALTRRTPNIYRNRTLAFEDLTIDLDKREVWRAGQEVTLRRKEFDILAYLAHNRGRTVTRAMILDHVWESDKDRWQNTVDVHIKHLRDKLDRPFGRPFIKTAYGIGYVFTDTSNVQT